MDGDRRRPFPLQTDFLNLVAVDCRRLDFCGKMESGGESEDANGSSESTWRGRLEVPVTVEELKVLLGRLGDLDDPYFKTLEVIRELLSLR